MSLALPCACVTPEDDLTRGNNPPQAALRAPVIAPLGLPVRFDASSSMDSDGDMLSYVFQWNDGSEASASADPIAFHTFAREALVTIVVDVLDIRNADAKAGQDVSIRADYPDLPDFCDATRPCVVGDECADGVCYSNGGSLE
jgi:hypothetical protein